MNSIIVPVRFPKKDVQYFDRMVKQGYYVSRGDAVKSLVQRGVSDRAWSAWHDFLDAGKKYKDLYPGKTSVEIAREAKKELWQEFLKKAGGDEERAAKMLTDYANKLTDERRKRASLR